MSRRVANGMSSHENYNCVVRISASAPTRIDLAGGTIDIWPLYLFHPGAQTLNVAISLRAHAWIERRPDDRIELVSEDTDRLRQPVGGSAARRPDAAAARPCWRIASGRAACG